MNVEAALVFGWTPASSHIFGRSLIQKKKEKKLLKMYLLIFLARNLKSLRRIEKIIWKKHAGWQICLNSYALVTIYLVNKIGAPFRV